MGVSVCRCVGVLVHVRVLVHAFVCVSMCKFNCVCACTCLRVRLCVTRVIECNIYLKSCSRSHPFAWKSSIAILMAGPCIWFITL